MKTSPSRFALAWLVVTAIALAALTSCRPPDPAPREGMVVPVLGQGQSRFSFIALGCLPYGVPSFPAFERLLDEIDYHRPAFTVHCGDIKAAAEPPSDFTFGRVRYWLNSLQSPVIYTPGDNEWTDVNRESAGNQDPVEWLGRIRKMFFTEERSLGRTPIPLITQRRDPAFAAFVENARWSWSNVTFATVHVVGSNNNRKSKVPSALAEFKARDAANVAWIRAVFAAAREAKSVGVALFMQAEPIETHAKPPAGEESGFAQVLAVLDDEVRAFGKPVLLVHADKHRYRNETPVRLLPERAPLVNLTRVETFGDHDVHAVKVIVDPDSTQVFLAGPLIVPGNALPKLPVAK